MAGDNRRSTRFSVEPDSTIKDIWQFSQRPEASFDPQGVKSSVMDFRRQAFKESRPSGGFPLGSLPTDSPQTRDDQITNTMKRRSTVNLQKSIQLLDEAVGTPSILRTGGSKTPMSLKHSTYTPGKVQMDASRFDVSASIGLTPGRSMMSTPGSRLSKVPESTMDVSMMAQAGSVTSMMLRENQSLSEDVATTNVALLLEEDPGVAACTGMFTDFLQSMQANGSEHQVFQLLAEYDKICEDNVTLLKKLVKRATPGQARFARTKDMLENISQEKYTWRLVASLYRDRLETEMKTDDEPFMMDSLGKRLSEKNNVDNLYERDASIRQAQLVVDWLEKNAEDDLEDFYERVEFFTDNTGTWENTLHSLKQKRAAAAGIGSHDRPMADQLDPDAPNRQHKPLADLDMEDDSRLLRYVFACVRAGQLDQAQKLCTRVGQSWRAATLEGWRPYHDPNFEDCGPGAGTTRSKVEGNPNRDVWKSVCWSLSQEEKLNIFERALYAVYSGNLQQLFTVCQTWQDWLWAAFRTMLDRKVEQEIRLNCSLNRPWQDLPAQYWEKILSAEGIFQELQACPSEEIRQQAKRKFHLIQKYIILSDLDSLIEEMYEWCRDEVNRPNQHLLRFMAHIVLFFRGIGMTTKEELCVSILEMYVRYLIEDRQAALVATYVATLPQELQIEWYAKFLEGVQEDEQRKQCLVLAEEAGLDIPEITKLVVENIRRRDTTEISMDAELPLEVDTTEEDRQKIEALDWLVFNPNQRAEAMRQANAILRNFLGRRKLAAARQVHDKIPANSIDLIMQTWQMRTNSTELSGEDANTVREYLCGQAYLDAHDSFNDWFKHYHHSKPQCPAMPPGANFTERVAYEHKMKDYEQELDRWQHSLNLQSQHTVDKIYNVLLFVDGGWMVDQRADAERDDARSHQMRLLRQICLPSLCFLLHTVLHTTGQYKQCLQLADIIASEHHQLYKVFRKDELHNLLQKLQESSVALLDDGLDPLGYELV